MQILPYSEAVYYSSSGLRRNLNASMAVAMAVTSHQYDLLKCAVGLEA